MQQAHHRRALAAIALTGFIATLDNTVVNVALPSIRRDLGLGVHDLEWIVTGYVLGFTGLLLVGGRLADQIGKRRTLLLGLAVFTAASVAAGLAASGGMLVAARVTQGTGAGLMVPAALALMADGGLTAAQRDTAGGLWMAAIASSLALGPAVGGTVSQFWSWNWIFFLNVPVGLLCALLLTGGPPGLSPPEAPEGPPGLRVRELDLPGALLSAAVLSGLTYALVAGPAEGFDAPGMTAVTALTPAAAVLFAVVQVRTRSPLVDFRLFRSRVFSGGTVAQLLWGVGVSGVFFFTSLFLQDVLGFTPTGAGLAFAPLALLVVLTSPLAVRLAAVLGERWVVSAGLLAVACGLLLLSRCGGDAAYWDLQPGFALIGTGSGLITPLVTVVLVAVPSERVGAAAGLVSAVREASGIFGVVLVGAVLSVRQEAALRAGRPPEAAFVLGYADGLRLAAALVLAGALVTALTLRGPGDGGGGAVSSRIRRRPGSARRTSRSGPQRRKPSSPRQPSYRWV